MHRPASEEELAAVCPCELGRVSVVLPVLDRCDGLDQTINSLLTQTHPNLDLIVVKATRSRGADVVLDRYLGREGVQFHTRPGATQRDAERSGFAVARGEF